MINLSMLVLGEVVACLSLMTYINSKLRSFGFEQTITSFIPMSYNNIVLIYGLKSFHSLVRRRRALMPGQ